MTRIIIRKEICIPRKPFLRSAVELVPRMRRNLFRTEWNVLVGSEFGAEACIKLGVGQVEAPMKTAPWLES